MDYAVLREVLDELEHVAVETDLLHFVYYTFVPDEVELFLKVVHDGQHELLVVDGFVDFV